MSFLYPYLITIKRPSGSLTNGPDGAVMGTTTVATNVPASIQLKRDKGFGAPVGFQGGATNTSAPMPAAMVYVPAAAGFAQGALRPGDQVMDQATGDLYKTDFASWSPMGWQLACVPYKPNA